MNWYKLSRKNPYDEALDHLIDLSIMQIVAHKDICEKERISMIERMLQNNRRDNIEKYIMENGKTALNFLKTNGINIEPNDEQERILDIYDLKPLEENLKQKHIKLSANNWYKKASLFGTDPFGSSELSQKTQLSPYGFAGGDERTGIFAPSDNNHHPNDVFSEDDKNEILEKQLEEAIKKFKKKKRIKKAQFGESSYWPHFDSPPNGGDKKDWVTKTYEEIEGKQEPEKKEVDDNQSIDIMTKSTYTIKSSNKNGGEIGTGFFYSKNMILTCYHVVNIENEISDNIFIKIDNNEYPCIFIDGDKSTDVAILEVESYASQDYLELGDSDTVSLGDKIFVYGAPLGFENIVQQGIVSSKPTSFNNGEQNQEFIFISANIVSGNSGGPVLSVKDNKVISIASGSISLDQNSGNLSVSVPINKAKELINRKQSKSLYDVYKSSMLNKTASLTIKEKYNKYTAIKEASGTHDPENINDMEKVIKHLEKFIGLDGSISFDDLEIFIQPMSIGAKRVSLRPYKLVGLIKQLQTLAKEYRKEEPNKNHNVLRQIRRDFNSVLKTIKKRIENK